MVKQKQGSNILDARVKRGSNCGSDHYLFTAKLVYPFRHLNQNNWKSHEEPKTQEVHQYNNSNIYVLLLSILFISWSVGFWKICISSLCSIDKLLFPYFSIFSFLLLLTTSSVSQIIKELCSSSSSSSSYSFHFHYLSFNDIMCITASIKNLRFS